MEFDVDYDILKKKLGHDTCKKVGAILDILEIGSPSIAHSKLVLQVCDDIIEKCSLTLGVKVAPAVSGEQKHGVFLNGEQISRFLVENRKKI